MNCWIWYPGDMELYFGMKQNFGRVERGCTWPAFWKSDGFHNRIVLSKEYDLREPVSFIFYAVKGSYGHCIVRNEEGEKKYPIGSKVTVPAGKVKIILHLACIETFPAAFVEGKVIYSDPSWRASDYISDEVPVGWNSCFQDYNWPPTEWKYKEEIYLPVWKKKGINTAGQTGTLFAFKTELTAQIELLYKKNLSEQPLVYEGESEAEVLDAKWCYYSFRTDEKTNRTPRAAVRYVFIPGTLPEEIDIKAVHQYVDIPVRAAFHSSNERINQIWDTASWTFRLCSGIFFIDGIKRDTWI